MSFTYAFYQHIMFRHSCGVCHYCNTRRPSDITLADFWGWENTNPEVNADDKGLSLILVNTPKGAALFKAVQDELNSFPVAIENALQPNLRHPSVIHPKRMDFEREYAGKGFVYVMRKYGDFGWQYKVKIFTRKIKSLPHWLIRKLLVRKSIG